jgi:hypothetical protein
MATKPFKSVTRESYANWSTTMTAPHYINENKSDLGGIKSGWYAIENDGTLSSGPFSMQRENHSADERNDGDYPLMILGRDEWMTFMRTTFLPDG